MKQPIIETFAAGDLIVLGEDLSTNGSGLQRVPVPVTLIVYNDRVVLVDTGLDPRSVDGSACTPYDYLGSRVSIVHPPEKTLPVLLGRRGLLPADVTDVVATHAHFEHIGGLELFHSATIHVGKADWDGAMTPSGPSALVAAPLARMAQCPHVLYTEDTDLFEDGRVSVLALPGHTPGTLGVIIDLNGHSVIVTGDVVESTEALAGEAPGPHDADQETARESIRRMKQVAADRDAAIWISHEARTWNRFDGN